MQYINSLTSVIPSSMCLDSHRRSLTETLPICMDIIGPENKCAKTAVFLRFVEFLENQIRFK